MTTAPAFPAVVEARDVSRVFPMPAGPVIAVRHFSLQIGAGDHVAICGPSGCGKSTLLHLLGLDHSRVTYNVQGRNERLTDVYDAKVLTPLIA